VEKIYIPAKGVCYTCGSEQDKAPFYAFGFANRPHRWVFCETCHVKWSGYSNTALEGGCPRKKIFKVVAGKETI
jgi:hypothetical protein